MADARFISPRRIGVTIFLHPAEASSVFCQAQLLGEMTFSELNAIRDAVNKELLTRGEDNDDHAAR